MTRRASVHVDPDLPVVRSARQLEELRAFTGGPYGEWVPVARVPQSGDGQDVVIEECAMPARFYRIVVGDKMDRVGGPRTRIELATGSSAYDLVWALAKNVANGMLGVRVAR